MKTKLCEKVFMCLECKTCTTNKNKCKVCGCNTFQETHPSNKPKEGEIIGKPLEDYIRDKHTQEECIGFIDGYIFRKSEELNNKDKTKIKSEVVSEMHDFLKNHFEEIEFQTEGALTDSYKYMSLKNVTSALEMCFEKTYDKTI